MEKVGARRASYRGDKYNKHLEKDCDYDHHLKILIASIFSSFQVEIEKSARDAICMPATAIQAE